MQSRSSRTKKEVFSNASVRHHGCLLMSLNVFALMHKQGSWKEKTVQRKLLFNYAHCKLLESSRQNALSIIRHSCQTANDNQPSSLPHNWKRKSPLSSSSSSHTKMCAAKVICRQASFLITEFNLSHTAKSLPNYNFSKKKAKSE